MLRFFAFYLSAIILLVLLVNYGFHEPAFRNKKVVCNPNFEKTIPGVKADTGSLDYNISLLNQHLRKPYFQESEGALLYRNDEAAEKYFQNFRRSEIDSIHDIGCLALMAMNNHAKLYDLAIKYNTDIKNKNIPYFNYYEGCLLINKGSHEEGIQALQRELGYKVYNDSSYLKQIQFYYAIKNYDELLKLYKDPEAKKMFYGSVRRDMYFLSFDVGAYMKTRFLTFDMNWKSFIAAFLITVAWFFYVAQLKIFQPKKWLDYIIVLWVGFFLSEFCLILYDIYEVIIGWRINGNIINDFLYCIFGIGFIEELFKIIPAFLYFTFRRKESEPIDYIIICALSALGFAFSEDVNYFRIFDDSFSIIHTRGINCLHLLCSGIAAYGFILKKYKQKGYGTVLLYFFAAAVCHGLYDLFLINKSLNLLKLYSYVMVFIGLYFFRLYTNNALNISPYFDPEKKLDSGFLKRYLIIALTGILLLEYLLNAFTDGPTTANDFVMEALIGFIIFLAVQASTLSNFDLIYDYIISPFTNRNKLYDALIGKTILFPIGECIQQATVLNHEVFNNSPDFFMIKMENPVTIGTETSEYFILQVRSSLDKKNVNTSYKGTLFRLDQELDLNTINKKLNVKTALANISFSCDKKKEEEIIVIPKNNTAATVVVFVAVFFMLFLFYNYMQFRTAVQAYYWAEEWLVSKDIYTASNNLLYAVHKRPSYTRAHLLLAKIDMSIGQYDEAEKRVRHVLEQSPDNTNALYLAAILSLRQPNDHTQTALIFEKIRKSPEAPDSTYYYEALIQMERREYSLATMLLDTFSQRTKLSSFEVNYNKGLCYFHKTNYKEAEKLLQTSIQLNPSHYEAYHYLGLCALEKKDTSAACMNFSRAYLHNVKASEQYIQSVCNYVIFPEVDSSFIR